MMVAYSPGGIGCPEASIAFKRSALDAPSCTATPSSCFANKIGENPIRPLAGDIDTVVFLDPHLDEHERRVTV
jgi:hypothetical protein